MARSRKCTARSGSFMSIVSNGTRQMGRACQSVFTPATLLLLASSLTRTGELGGHSILEIHSKDSGRRATLDRKDRSKTAKSSDDIVVDVGV